MQRCEDDYKVEGSVEGTDQLEAVGYGQFKSYRLDLIESDSNGQCDRILQSVARRWQHQQQVRY